MAATGMATTLAGGPSRATLRAEFDLPTHHPRLTVPATWTL